MPYIANEHHRPSSDELRARIPGWGADLDPATRPSVPKERYDLETGAHWLIPENQPELQPRERSIEHGMLPPVFGTTAPLHGMSGIIRRFAYQHFSEARAAHWLLLVLGDRVDVLGSRARSALAGHPDNPLAETGVLAEPRHHPLRSRLGRHRADLAHVWIDPILIIGPTAVVAASLLTLRRRR